MNRLSPTATSRCAQQLREELDAQIKEAEGEIDAYSLCLAQLQSEERDEALSETQFAAEMAKVRKPPHTHTHTHTHTHIPHSLAHVLPLPAQRQLSACSRSRRRRAAAGP
jgi:hypothetical protein